MSSNPSIQCSVCGQWKRLHGVDGNGIAIQRFYSCCGKNGEFNHEKEVCDECCKTKCPYRMKNELAQKIYLALNAEGLPVYDIHKHIIQKAIDESESQPSSDQIAGMKDAFNDKTIKKTIKDLPKDYKWEDIFEIGIGIPTGTKNFLSTYFSVPNLASYNQSPSTGGGQEQEEWNRTERYETRLMLNKLCNILSQKELIKNHQSALGHAKQILKKYSKPEDVLR